MFRCTAAQWFVTILVMCHVFPGGQVNGMVPVILGVGFVLLSLTLLVLLLYTVIKRLTKCKVKCKLTKTDIITVEGADRSAQMICFHLYRVQKSSLLLDNIVILLLYNLLSKYKILSEFETSFIVYNPR